MRRFSLLIGDIAILYTSLFTTLVLRYGFDLGVQAEFHLLPFSITFISWLIVFYISNLYDLGYTKNNIQFFSALLYSLAVNTVISLLFFYLVPFFGIAPKTNLIIFTLIVAALMISWRYGFNKLIAKSGFKNNTLIIGANEQSQELYDFLLANPQIGYNALGIIDIEDQDGQAIIQDLIHQKNIRTLVLSPAAYKIPRIIDAFYRMVGFGVSFYGLSDFYERVTGRIPLGTIDQIWFLENLSKSRMRGYEIGKRILDLIGAIILGITTIILYPLIIIAIKTDSSGPIFYKQRRMGRAGKIFDVIKFRTMFSDAEKNGAVWASENDARTTRVGKIIRKTRIDELPQFWNIIRGDMSFVGPRPERPEFKEKIQAEVPFYEERYLVKPGLTGWAQIKYKLDFKGGMTVKDTYEKLQYDLYYVKNRSIVLDLGIVLKTINILLKKTLG